MIDVIVVGGGIAGLTAAIYIKRSGKEVLVIEKEACGGQLLSAPLVENFPGYMPLPGAELIDKVIEQADALGIRIEYTEVVGIGKYEDSWIVETESYDYCAHSVIIATGASHKHIPNVEGDKVSYCAVCDGAFYKNKTVAVIGDGNSALQYSLMLSDICNKVWLCTWSDKLFGDNALIQRIQKTPNIEQIKFVNVQTFDYERLYMKDLTKENAEKVIKVDGVFVAIGQKPNTELVKNIAKLDKIGYIIADKMNIDEGLFVAGDCRMKDTTRQAITAASEGAIAAMEAVKYLNTKGE